MSEGKSTRRYEKKHLTEEQRKAAARKACLNWVAKNLAAGLCRCGRERDSSAKMCRTCRDKFKARYAKIKATRAANQVSGRCRCGWPVKEGKKSCESCLDQCIARNQKRLAMWKRAGVCTTCGSERMEGRMKCATCCARAVRRQRRYRHQVFETYGGYKCACCGETEYDFLTIDHVNNDGAEHRKRLTQKGGMYRDIVKQGFPAGVYQVLCMNCNWGKRRCGVCPHQMMKCEAVSDASHQDAVGD